MRPVRTGGLAAALCILGLASAQGTPSLPIGDPALRDAKAPKGEPNISGVWQVRGTGLRIQPTAGGDPPWKPWV